MRIERLSYSPRPSSQSLCDIRIKQHASDSISSSKASHYFSLPGCIRAVFTTIIDLFKTGWRWIKNTLFGCCRKKSDELDETQTPRVVSKLIDCMKNLDVDAKPNVQLFYHLKKELTPKALDQIKAHLKIVLSEQLPSTPIDDSTLDSKFYVNDQDLLKALESYKKELTPQD